MVTTEQLQVLSAAPWFDKDVATDLLAITDADAGDSTVTTLDSLRRAGLLIHRGSAWRVVEPLRAELRASFAGTDEVRYRQALRMFAEHAANGFRPQLDRVMGKSGAELNARVIDAAGSDDVETFDRLVRYVEDSSRDGERGEREAFAAAQLLTTYSQRHDRRSDFLNGLGLWRSGEKVAAEASFRRVHQYRQLDSAAAISTHLLGLQEYSRGRLDEAVRLIEESVGYLEFLADARGLAISLTSLGRVLKDRYRDDGRLEDLDESIAVLSRAAELLNGSSTSDRVATLIAFAQALQAADALDDARSKVDEASELAARGEQAVLVAIAAIPIYRSLDMDRQAVDIADAALRKAESEGLEDLTVARLLNTSAATLRKLRSFPAAARLASRSVELGQHIGNQRHTAHALHTLASIYIDELSEAAEEAPHSAEDIRGLLQESRGILAALHNKRGLTLVDNTLRRLHTLELQQLPAALESSEWGLEL